METAPVVQYVMGKQGLWPASLLKFNPEHSYMKPDHCEESVELSMRQYEDSLAQAFLNSFNNNILLDPAADLQPQLKCEFVQNCLHDLAVISVEADQYEIKTNEMVLHYNRGMEELAKVASYRGTGFAHDNFGLPVPTSTLNSIRQNFLLLIYCWDNPLKFGQLLLAHMLKIQECQRVESENRCHFWEGYMMKKVKEMEHMDLNLKKTYQRYLQIDQCIRLGSPRLELGDTVGRLRCHITRDLALPLLQQYNWKMWTALTKKRNIQIQWCISELRYMISGDLSRRQGIWDALVGFSIGSFISGYVLNWWNSPCSW